MAREDQLAQALEEIVRYTRTLTRLEAVIEGAGNLSTLLVKIHDDDQDLGPEVTAALTKLQDVLVIVGESGTFLEERCRVAFERLTKEVPPE